MEKAPLPPPTSPLSSHRPWAAAGHVHCGWPRLAVAAEKEGMNIQFQIFSSALLEPPEHTGGRWSCLPPSLPPAITWLAYFLMGSFFFFIFDQFSFGTGGNGETGYLVWKKVRREAQVFGFGGGEAINLAFFQV